MANPRLLSYDTKNGEILIQEEGIENYCSDWRKGKLKIKKLSKITVLDEQEPSLQSVDRTKAVQVWSWGNMYSSRPRN